MLTRWGETLDKQQVLQEYPRPQLVRESFYNLNGLWDYAITASDACPGAWDGQILVPFSPEAPLSGVGKTLRPGQVLWYRRPLPLKKRAGMRTLLHFGAVDQRAWVYVNGLLAGTHTGGYTAFTLDITKLLREGENTLTVAVRDDTDAVPLSRGKQKTKRGGIWYTPQSGIWQTVWAEQVPERYIGSLLFTPELPEGRMTRLRAELVCEQSLHRVALELHLGDYLRLGKGEEHNGGREPASILSDAVEAVIAAMYLDAGMETAAGFIHRCLLDDVRTIETPSFTDYKTALQELVQAKKNLEDLGRKRQQLHISFE